MKKFDSQAGLIVSAKELVQNIFDFSVHLPQLAAIAQPGQFAQIFIPGRTLRRPISICGVNRQEGTLRFVFEIRGEGTAELARFKEGDSLEVLAPLGKGFPVETDKRVLLIGGGIGVPPLLELAARLKGNALAVLGFRNKAAVILEKDFEAVCSKTIITTDDGSYGLHGLVTEAAKEESFDMVCACGPTPMLQAVVKLAEIRNVPCFVSLEQRMACGVGACLGCATPLLDESGGTYFGHVCKDGPVFNAKQVVLG